ncbi:TetR family transcriptional regulator, partial [Streptomyces olivaceus]|uniref:TetR family transcriptional regulator n=1 Tax=Streptomyces olivaceus TaxID=47716 RepID=UPI004055B30A
MAQVKPMRADARRNRERLLRAAAGVFAEHGAGASLDDIARRAEVGTGTLYRHFPTRQALLEAVYLESVEAIAARADTIAAARPPGAPARPLSRRRCQWRRLRSAEMGQAWK